MQRVNIILDYVLGRRLLGGGPFGTLLKLAQNNHCVLIFDILDTSTLSFVRYFVGWIWPLFCFSLEIARLIFAIGSAGSG